LSSGACAWGGELDVLVCTSSGSHRGCICAFHEFDLAPFVQHGAVKSLNNKA